VNEILVMMRMGMRLVGGDTGLVRVLVVFVVDVDVRMVHRFVAVDVLVVLTEQEHDAARHECSGRKLLETE
jgi:hypothetical protein